MFLRPFALIAAVALYAAFATPWLKVAAQIVA